MTDFDPDRMSADDVDVNDPAAIDAWLNHPNTKALHDDLGRAFRTKPAEQQQERLQRVIDADESRLRELDETLAKGSRTPAARAALERLRTAMQSSLDAAQLRLLVLDDE